MKIQIYTSCSINYLPKARVLARSVQKNSPGAKVTLLLNDIIPEWLDLSLEPFEAIWTPYDLGYDSAWIFQHNVMEICTAVKGRALSRLMEQNEADIYVYLDPDCYVFHSLDIIDEYLGDASIGLIPHVTQPAETDIEVHLTEISVVEHGTYNLGHLFVRSDENGKNLAQWWAKRLDKYCFEDKERGLFTDQRWMDLVPAIFERVKILRLPNLDVASWNLFGKTIIQEKPEDITSFVINGYPLVTYHFSGTGPTGTHRRVREILAPCNSAAAEIERMYEAAIASEGQAELENWRYGYDFFDDGSLVTAEARKIYRRHADLKRTFPNPFDSDNENQTYQRWLKLHRPGAIEGICLSDKALRQAFFELFDEKFYLTEYPTVAKAIEDGDFQNPLEHYVKEGSRLLYNPNVFFYADYYYAFAKNYDGYVLRQKQGSIEGTLLWHYLTVGLANKLEPIPYFNSHWYLSHNKDVKKAMEMDMGVVTCPLAHFFNAGAKENRKPCADFDPTVYMNRNEHARKLIEDKQVLRGGFEAFLRLTMRM